MNEDDLFIALVGVRVTDQREKGRHPRPRGKQVQITAGIEVSQKQGPHGLLPHKHLIPFLDVLESRR